MSSSPSVVEEDEPSSILLSNLYHERQSLALCGVHAVNNLLQTKRYVKSDFDQLCTTLSPDSHWFNNPHKSALGIGNYDVNVVTVLLQQEGYSVQWHDQRNELTPEILDDDSVAAAENNNNQNDNESKDNDSNNNRRGVVGVLWNVPSRSILGRIVGGRHWIALLSLGAGDEDDDDDNNNNSNSSRNQRQQRQWVNLDSDLAAPELVGNSQECVQLLNAQRKDSHVLLVSRGGETENVL